MIERFRELFAQRYENARERKAQGKKIIGWLCTYAPEEIFYAAGMDTFRVLGGATETHQADAHMYSNMCTFVRNCLEEGFRKRYDFLEGLVACNSCDHIKRLFDVWLRYLPIPYMHVFNLPCKADGYAVSYLKKDYARIRRGLEESFGLECSDQALSQAIQLYNQTRSLLKKLYDLRRSPSPPISGAETMEVVRAGMVMPKDQYNPLLEALLEGMAGKEGISDDRIRLLIMGSELDDPVYIQAIEDCGGLVVADDLCCGSRYFWNLVEDAGDPLEAIARRYLTHPPCPQMHPAGWKIKIIKKMIEEFKVEGIIYQTIKFCQLHASVYPVYKNLFNEMGIPHLFLEREYIFAGTGQIRTRVQAFFERIREGINS